MSKIFRLYKEGADTYQDWNESPAFPYTSTALGTIDDPDGASAKNEITSIPSPFARIDLIKSAFKEVCRMGLDGKTIFHKMVSDALDVGEIFFNIDKYAKKVEIITWNVDSMLQELKDSIEDYKVDYLLGKPKILPNCTMLRLNLNFLTGKLPDWLLYHPHFLDWAPDLLIFNQQYLYNLTHTSFYLSNTIVMVVPFPKRLSALILPPCCDKGAKGKTETERIQFYICCIID